MYDESHSVHQNSNCGLGSVGVLGGEEENVFLEGVTAARMLGDVQVMMGQYILGCGKMIYGETLVKMFLHQLWDAEQVEQHVGPRYNCRSTNLCIFDIVSVVVIQFHRLKTPINHCTGP